MKTASSTGSSTTPINYFAPFPLVKEITLLQGGVHTFVLNDDDSDAEPDLIDFVLTKGKI